MTNESTEGSTTDGETTENTADSHTGGRTLGRRSALKAAGGLIAGGAALGTAGTASAYNTITVSAGETRIIRLGDGETLENTLIDASASGADVRINASGSGWAIRNVAIRGVQTNPHHTIIATVDAGGVGVVENCWFGDGADQEFVYVHRNHAGTVKIRNCHIANADTGIYGSAPAPGGLHNQTDGNEGVVEIENCYLKNITHSHVILGTDGSYARNCVADSPNHGEWQVVCYNRWENVEFADWDIRTGGVAFKSGNTSGSSTGSDAVTAVRNCRVDADSRTFVGPGSYSSRGVSGSPDLSPPAGVPMTPQEAVSGSSGSAVNAGSSTDSNEEPETDSTAGDWREIIISGESSSYQFTASEAVERLSSPGGDNADGTEASGSVHGWKDGYRFQGSITSFSHDGPVTVTIDGEGVDPDSLGGRNSESTGSSGDSDSGSGSDSDSDAGAGSDGSASTRELVVSTVETGASANYEFTTSGGVETLDSPSGDYAEGNRAYGSVHGWKDGYSVSGQVTSFSADGPVTVYLDGEEVDPDSLGGADTGSDGSNGSDDSGGSSESSGSREVLISNVGSDEAATYRFTASDSVRRLDSPSGDYVEGNRAHGSVHGWKDGYVVEGEISSFSHDGPVTVTVDGEEVDPDSLD